MFTLRHLSFWKVLPAFCVALIMTAIALPASAWTVKTHEEIALDAMRLAPKYLQVVLENQKDAVLEGARGPQEEGKQALTGWEKNFQDSDLPKAIDEEAATIIKMFRKNKALSEVAFRFGRLAYLASLAENPLNLDNTDTREIYYYVSFDGYVEENLPNFRVVFQGFSPEYLATEEPSKVLLEKTAKLKTMYPRLGEAFYKKGKIVPAKTFGPTSVPFGIAFLGYNHSVVSVAEIWNNVWLRAGGDTRLPEYAATENPVVAAAELSKDDSTQTR